MNTRFRDEGKTIGSFVGEFYVKCPRCGKFVCTKNSALSCDHCSFTRTGHNRPDSLLGPSLWLKAKCCGHTLWANNLAHLEYIEKYVAAGTRQAFINDKGIFNRSMVSCLPKWLSSSKNREEILKCIVKMKETLPSKYKQSLETHSDS